MRAGIVLVLAIIAAAGCGSSDDGGDNGSAATGADNGSATAGATPASDDRQPATEAGRVRRLLADLQKRFVAGDGKAYCDGLTAAGRRSVVEYSRAWGRDETCRQFIATRSKRNRAVGVKQKPTVVLSVKVDGNRAVARISDGGRPPQPMVFVKRYGEWKLPDPGFKQVLEAFRNSSDAPPGQVAPPTPPKPSS